jgi:glutaredoxin
MAKPSGITMYTRDGCGDCILAKRVMSKHDVGYAEIDILSDDSARAEVMRIKGVLQTEGIIK